MRPTSIPALAAGLLALLLAATSHAGAPVQALPGARAALDAGGFQGVVLILDLENAAYAAEPAERADVRLIPASTFKVFTSLVAIETGVVDGPDTVVAWDGVVRGREEVNLDLDLHAAFHLSAVPHFQALARAIGAERMQAYLDAVGYGNRDMSGGIDTFWLTGGLRISPREQVDFLARLLRDALPFSPETMAAVRAMMRTERGPGHALHAKTGWAMPPDGENVGWWVGWVERDAGTHVFATALWARDPGEGFGPARLTVTRDVLQELGVLEPGP